MNSKKNSENLEKVLSFLKDFYKKERNQWVLYEFEEFLQKPLMSSDCQEFSKKLLQFLFYNNLSILKAKSLNSLRHNFPKNLSETDDSSEFFNLLHNIFRLIDIDVKTVESSKIEYFYFENYKSLFKLLLYWDDDWIKFPRNEIEAIRVFINDFEIYINFNSEFINQIFSVFKKHNMTLTKFFENIINIANTERESKYQRHAIYKWRDNKFLPINVLVDLMNSIYRKDIDTDFFKYIESIKIGKSKKEDIIDRTLLIDIKTQNYELIKNILPLSSSKLGWILFYLPEVEDNSLNLLYEYEKFLKNYTSTTLKKNRLIVDDIKRELKPLEEIVFIKSLKLTNFKFYSYQEFNFHNGINIFYGLNGSGKTSIFEAIFFALRIPIEEKDIYELKRLDPIELDFLNTNFVKVGEEYCEVELVLKKGDNTVKILRKLWKDGRHKIILNDEDILNKINLSKYKSKNDFQENNNSVIENGGIEFYIIGADEHFELADDVYARTTFSQDRKLNEVIHLGYYTELLLKEIRREYKNNDCSFKKHDILFEFGFLFRTLMGLSNRFFSLFSRDKPLRDLTRFYKKRINIDFIEKVIARKNEKIKKIRKIVENQLHRSFRFPKNIKFFDKKLYDFYSYGKIKPCERCNKNFDNINQEDLNDWSIGVQCAGCGARYCPDCIKKLNGFICDCDNEIYFELFTGVFDLDTLDLTRNIKHLKYFDYKFDLLISILEKKPYNQSDSNESDIEKLRGFKKEIHDINEEKFFLIENDKFLHKLSLDFMNDKLIKFTKQFYKKNKFYSFLDESGFPKIKFIESGEIYPISNLSGGEKSKLFLGLLGILIGITRKTSFFLIDEPNELFDPINIDLMKQFFLKLFTNKQLIINTFIEKYKEFQPALIYEVLKDRNNISHAFQLPKESYKLKRFIAIDEIEGKIEMYPDNPKYRIDKYWILFHSKKHMEAKKTIEEGIKLFPFYLGFYELKAIFGADVKERLDTYDKIIELKGSLDFGQFYNRHNDLYALGRYEDALSDINKVIENEPDDYFNYEERAVVLAELERFEESLKDIDKADELRSEPVKPKAQGFQSPKVRIYSLIAKSHLRAQEKEKAIEAIKKAIEHDIEGFESETNSIYGDILMAFGDFKEAIEKYEKAKELSFTPVETYINLGKCLMELEQYDDALEHLKIGRNLAANDVVKTKEGIEYQSNISLIKEAEKLITEIEREKKKLV